MMGVIGGLGGAALAAPERPLLDDLLAGAREELLDWQPLTKAPGFHWFSYYDIQQFDASGRYVLGMRVDFEGRQPVAGEAVEVGMVDLRDGNRWIRLGESRAWCWQQGCRLQWRPGSDREVLWNDIDNGQLVCRVHDIVSGMTRTLPSAIDHLHPDGKSALVADFARVGWMRPDYGYPGVQDPNRKVDAPADSGIWRVDLTTGERKLLISLEAIAGFATPGYVPGAKKGAHYVNHLAWSPGGGSFMFLHRGAAGRMLVADADGSHLRWLADDPSHYTWDGEGRILCWTKSAYRYFPTDGTSDGRGTELLRAPNGHQTLVPGTPWMLTDTYPETGHGAERIQYVYLYNIQSGAKVIIGKFPSPKEYAGMWRCDTHPRLSRDSTKVTIDSAHAGGRQIYMTDISKIIQQP